MIEIIVGALIGVALVVAFVIGHRIGTRSERRRYDARILRLVHLSQQGSEVSSKAA